MNGHSAMKLVKTCLRNRTGDQRLTDLVTMLTCKDCALDREEIIESYANASTRHVQFLYKSMSISKCMIIA